MKNKFILFVYIFPTPIMEQKPWQVATVTECVFFTQRPTLEQQPPPSMFDKMLADNVSQFSKNRPTLATKTRPGNLAVPAVRARPATSAVVDETPAEIDQKFIEACRANSFVMPKVTLTLEQLFLMTVNEAGAHISDCLLNQFNRSKHITSFWADDADMRDFFLDFSKAPCTCYSKCHGAGKVRKFSTMFATIQNNSGSLNEASSYPNFPVRENVEQVVADFKICVGKLREVFKDNLMYRHHIILPDYTDADYIAAAEKFFALRESNGFARVENEKMRGSTEMHDVTYYLILRGCKPFTYVPPAAATSQ